jgi:hypothetical protein
VRMRVSLFIAMLLLTGCAGPPGPPFGPGPEVDTAFGILVILLFAGLLYRAAKGWQNPKHFEPPPFTLRARGVPEFPNTMRGRLQTASDSCERKIRCRRGWFKGLGNTCLKYEVLRNYGIQVQRCT